MNRTQRSICLAFFVLFSWTTSLSGQILQPPSNNPAETPAPQGDQRLVNAWNEATRSLAAFRADDFAACANFAHPGLLEDIGGRERMIEMTRMAKLALTEQTKGYDSSVDQPKRLIVGQKELYAVVPQNVTIHLMSGNVMNRKSWLFGVSGDAGRTWKFIDGAEGPHRIRTLVPGFPQQELLPGEAQAQNAEPEVPGPGR